MRNDSSTGQVEECAYCGAAQPQTRDHVPPVGLFPKPRASTLITVPCCEDCRIGWSDDDEYFRAAVVNDISVYDSEGAQPIIASLLRSMGKPQKRGFSRSILDSIHEVEVTTPAGIYVGKADALRLDAPRINRVGARIVRGLFFHEKGHRVPENYDVGGRLQPFRIEALLENLKKASLPAPKVVQGSVFDYSFRATQEDPDASLLLARFYGVLYFLGWTRPQRAEGT